MLVGALEYALFYFILFLVLFLFSIMNFISKSLGVFCLLDFFFFFFFLRSSSILYSKLKMQHNSLLQKFTGTKYFETAEKNKKLIFKFIITNCSYSTLQIQNFKLHFLFYVVHSTQGS